MISISTIFLTLMAKLQWPMELSKELALGGAAAVTLCGMWLCWGTAEYRMWVEERIKDGKMTSEAAQRKITRRNLLGPAVTTLGMGLLLYVATN